MKYLHTLVFVAMVATSQQAKAETLSLETFIQQALQNSPEALRIVKDTADVEGEAVEIEALENPTIQVDLTAFEKDASRSVEIEIEQPLRLSDFGTRQAYADSLRQARRIEYKAQKLALVHALTRAYASYWALQEQEKLLSRNVSYAQDKQKLITEAALSGFVDASDAQIFKAEALRLGEQLRTLRAQKSAAAANLLRSAGMAQRGFEASRPISPHIPALGGLSSVSGGEASVKALLESRKVLADRRYALARKDAGLSEFTPRAVLERDFDEGSTSLVLGVNVAIPVWNRGRADIAKAMIERQLVKSQLNALNEYNYANFLAVTYEQAKATQASASTYRNKIVPSWDDVQKLMDRKFENGQASILDLFQMRERITSVQQESLQSYLESIDARIALESLIGSTLMNLEK
ncbi:MAG: TolC family protein [Alphaproteobacteria bacterium]